MTTVPTDDAFRVPAGINSPYVVYSTGFETHDEGCRVCGDPAEPPPRVQPLHCSRAHKKLANRVRSGKRQQHQGFTGQPGTCGYCGAELEPGPAKRATLCAKPECHATYRTRGFGVFRKRVEWPQPLPWLAKQIKRPPDDPQLPQLALALASKRVLAVYVRADGTVGEVGRPKQPRVHVPPRFEEGARP